MHIWDKERCVGLPIDVLVRQLIKDTLQQNVSVVNAKHRRKPSNLSPILKENLCGDYVRLEEMR